MSECIILGRSRGAGPPKNLHGLPKNSPLWSIDKLHNKKNKFYLKEYSVSIQSLARTVTQ